MKKRTFTGIATAALITTAGISVTNNLKPENPLKTGEGTVQAATYQQEFLNKAIPAATTASSKYGTYTSVMLAQAAVESAWGQSGLAQSPNNNLFGIKGSYNGQSVNMNTGEYGSNGYYTTNAGFRKYPSYTESFEWYRIFPETQCCRCRQILYLFVWRSKTGNKYSSNQKRNDIGRKAKDDSGELY